MSEQVRGPLMRNLIDSASGVTSLRVVNQTNESADVIRARVEWLEDAGKSRQAELRFAREAGQWKPAFNITRSQSGGYGGTFFLPLGAPAEAAKR